MFSLSDTPVDSQCLSGGGECIKQHSKQILPNQVEKKLELQHKYPKTWQGLTAERSSVIRKCIRPQLFPLNLFLHKKCYVLGTKFCKKLEKSFRFLGIWQSVGVSGIKNNYFQSHINETQLVSIPSRALDTIPASPDLPIHTYLFPQIQIFSLQSPEVSLLKNSMLISCPLLRNTLSLLQGGAQHSHHCVPIKAQHNAIESPQHFC